MKRRKFIKTTTAGATGIVLGKSMLASVSSIAKVKHPIHLFTKCLQFLNFNEIASVLAELGFDGADITVRPKGQILPVNVAIDLPKAVKTLRNVGVDSNMIVTNINNPDDPFTHTILKTMANLGIQYYRMGYISFDHNKSIPQNLDELKSTFKKLEKINRKYGVRGEYQNHAGTRLGGPVWDLYLLLKDIDPEFIGVQYDIRHATVEGASSWPLGMKLIAPWIKTTDIKDFIWSNDDGNWKIKDVPLGEGMVDFKTYFTLYKSLKIDAPVSIHCEYDLGGAEHGDLNPTMDRDTIFSWINKDVTFLKKQFEQFDIK